MNKAETLPTVAAELLDGQQLIARLSNPDDPEDWETQRIRYYRAWSHIEVALNSEAADHSDAEHHFAQAAETATPQGTAATDTLHLTTGSIMLRAYLPIFRDRRFKGPDDISISTMHDSLFRLGSGLKFIRKTFEKMPDQTLERAHYVGRFVTHASNLYAITSGQLESRHLLMPASVREETGFPGKTQYSNHDAYTLQDYSLRKQSFRFKSTAIPGRVKGTGRRIEPEAIAGRSSKALDIPEPTETLNIIGEIMERKIANERLTQSEREALMTFTSHASSIISGVPRN